MIQYGAHDSRAGLDRLQDALDPPQRIGSYHLIGLVARTETSLVYVAAGGVFGGQEGILKLTSPDYAPLLERELAMLVRCEQAEVDGVVRPLSPVPLELRLIRPTRLRALAVALPFRSVRMGLALADVRSSRTIAAPGEASALNTEAAPKQRSTARRPMRLRHSTTC